MMVVNVENNSHIHSVNEVLVSSALSLKLLAYILSSVTTILKGYLENYFQQYFHTQKRIVECPYKVK
jgi:hypothetical protein